MQLPHESGHVPAGPPGAGGGAESESLTPQAQAMAVPPRRLCGFLSSPNLETHPPSRQPSASARHAVSRAATGRAARVCAQRRAAAHTYTDAMHTQQHTQTCMHVQLHAWQRPTPRCVHALAPDQPGGQAKQCAPPKQHAKGRLISQAERWRERELPALGPSDVCIHTALRHRARDVHYARRYRHHHTSQSPLPAPRPWPHAPQGRRQRAHAHTKWRRRPAACRHNKEADRPVYLSGTSTNWRRRHAVVQARAGQRARRALRKLHCSAHAPEGPRADVKRDVCCGMCGDMWLMACPKHACHAWMQAGRCRAGKRTMGWCACITMHACCMTHPHARC